MMVAMRPIVVAAWAAVCAIAATAAAGDVVHFRVEDTIQPASQRFIERALAEAEQRGAALVVMELDTPGGLLDATRKITTAITGSAVPVAVYVSPAGARAASAGFFILLAADVAAMAPGTNTGAAHPVGGQGENLPEDVRDKATNDAAAMIQAVRRASGAATSTWRSRRSGRARRTPPTRRKTTGLVDLVADDLDDLLEKLSGTEVQALRRLDRRARARRADHLPDRAELRRPAALGDRPPQRRLPADGPRRARDLLRDHPPRGDPARRHRGGLPAGRPLLALGAAGELRRRRADLRRADAVHRWRSR